MTEIHLDLCIQSTNHLLDTVSKIKENVRILEVFLNSGLVSIIDFPDNNTGLMNGYSEGKESIGSEPRFCQNNAAMGRHLTCCCMCRFRQTGIGRVNFNGLASQISAATASLSSNTSIVRKSRPTPIMPRLNKTASLRRERMLQKQSSQETSRKASVYR